MNLNAAPLPVACRIKFRFFSGTSKSCRPGLSPSVEPYLPQFTFISSYFRPDCLLFLCFFIFVGCSFICICTSSNMLLLPFCILSPPQMPAQCLVYQQVLRKCLVFEPSRPEQFLARCFVAWRMPVPFLFKRVLRFFPPLNPFLVAFAHFSFSFITRPQTVHRRPAKREPGGKSQVISPAACDHYNLWPKSSCTVLVFPRKLS